MTEEKEYSEIALKLLKDVRETDWQVWDRDAEELARDVSAMISFISHLSHMVSTIMELYHMRRNGHEMSLKDYTIDRGLLEHLKQLRSRCGRIRNIIETYTNSFVDETIQDHEVRLWHDIAPCGYDAVIRQTGHSVQEFCKARRDIYIALLPLMLKFRRIVAYSMLLIVRERQDFVSMWLEEYEDWLLLHRPSVERRLKNGLYKDNVFGKTILPLQSMIPNRDNWGEALGLKMQQIRMDKTFCFIDSDEFHEVGRPIVLTSRMHAIAMKHIAQSMSIDDMDYSSYDEQMRIFYRHISEINILKEKIEQLAEPSEGDTPIEEEGVRTNL